MSDWSDTELLIKTLSRPSCLERLLKSIRVYYPDIAVRVLDDTPWEDSRKRAAEHCAQFSATYMDSEKPDIGISAGRNRLIQASPATFVVILEDDFEFTEQTDLNAMRDPLLRDEYDIIGGALENSGMRSHFEGYLDLTDGVLTLTPLKDYTVLQRCDITFNFLMGYRLRFPMWDERLIVVEHLDAFLQAKYTHPRRIGYQPACAISHKPYRPNEYKQFRMRIAPYRDLCNKIWGIKETRGSLG